MAASCAFGDYGDIIFQDDFSSGNLNNWDIIRPFGNPEWVVENGWAKAPSGGWARAVVGGSKLSLKDFKMEADMRRLEASPGLFAHGADWNHNLMFVHWILSPPNDIWSARIWIQSGDDSGYVKYATQTTGGVLDTSDCHIAITYINDVATCTMSDYYGHSFTATGAVGPAEGLQGAGYLGLLAEGETYYDNVVITDLTVPEPGSLATLTCGLLGMASTLIKRRR